MTGKTDNELLADLRALLEPGDIELAGMIVGTGLGPDEEIALQEAILSIGETVADVAGVEGWYVYSGNDNPEFSSNQHQGLSLDDDAFLWECQTLFHNGELTIVIYYEAMLHDALPDAVRNDGYSVTGVTVS